MVELPLSVAAAYKAASRIRTTNTSATHLCILGHEESIHDRQTVIQAQLIPGVRFIFLPKSLLLTEREGESERPKEQAILDG